MRPRHFILLNLLAAGILAMLATDASAAHANPTSIDTAAAHLLYGGNVTVEHGTHPDLYAVPIDQVCAISTSARRGLHAFCSDGEGTTTEWEGLAYMDPSAWTQVGTVKTDDLCIARVDTVTQTAHFRIVAHSSVWNEISYARGTGGRVSTQGLPTLAQAIQQDRSPTRYLSFAYTCL